MHQRRRLLAALSQKQAARATIPLAVRVAHRWSVLHACSECDAQGVTRARIRTNECLGRAQEVALAAHASTEALAGGAELKASGTCNHPLGGVRGNARSRRWESSLEAAGDECRSHRTRSARLRAILQGLSTRDDTAHTPGKHGGDPQESESSALRATRPNGVVCMHEVRCSGRHPQADPHQ